MLSGLDIFYSVMAPVFRHAAKKYHLYTRKLSNVFTLTEVSYGEIYRDSQTHIFLF